MYVEPIGDTGILYEILNIPNKDECIKKQTEFMKKKKDESLIYEYLSQHFPYIVNEPYWQHIGCKTYTHKFVLPKHKGLICKIMFKEQENQVFILIIDECNTKEYETQCLDNHEFNHYLQKYTGEMSIYGLDYERIRLF